MAAILRNHDFLLPDLIAHTSFISVMSIGLSCVLLIASCFLPESPHYRAYCEMKKSHDFEKTVKTFRLWSAEDVERKSIKDMFVELKKLNLLSLIGLILVEQFIGGVSILFYIKYFARLTGEWVVLEIIFTFPSFFFVKLVTVSINLVSFYSQGDIIHPY
jgi:hypothetical protein